MRKEKNAMQYTKEELNAMSLDELRATMRNVIEMREAHPNSMSKKMLALDDLYMELDDIIQEREAKEKHNMSKMRSKLTHLIKQEGLDNYIVDSFEIAKTNNRRKNIVLAEDGIYLTFKANIGRERNIFGELVCWVDDEFNEDPSVYTSAINAIVELFSYSDEELNTHIKNDDLIETFTEYDEEVTA